MTSGTLSLASLRVLLATSVLVFSACPAPLHVLPGDTLDFGVLELGASNTSPLTFFSQSVWTLQGVESTGAPVAFAPFLEGPGVFIVEMDPAFGLTGPFVREDFVVQHFLGLRARFDPPAVSVETPFAASLTLTFVSTEGVTERVRFSLRGVALAFTCGRVPELRFGGVALGDERSLELELQNPRDELDQISIFLRQPSVFSLSPSGSFTLAAREAVRTTVTWRPQQLGLWFGVLDVGVSRLCPSQEVGLSGQSIEPLGVADGPHFPLTPVGGSSTANLRLRNFVRRPVAIEGFAVRDTEGFSTEFSLPPRVVLPAATFELGELVPAELDVPLTFTPSREGPRNAQLSLSVDVPLSPFFDVLLEGKAGGPDVELAPRKVRLAPVDGVAIARLVLVNTGTTDSRLRLGTPGWVVRALDGGSPDEVCVGSYKPSGNLCLGTLAGYDPQVGLVGTQLAVPVRVAPQSPGPRRYAIDFFTDDFDEPVVTAELVVP